MSKKTMGFSVGLSAMVLVAADATNAKMKVMDEADLESVVEM
jgi:hypothetical protein